MSVTVTLSYEERILNALTHVPRHRDDDAITRTKREFDTVREVLTPLYADRDRALAAAKELRGMLWYARSFVCQYGTDREVADIDRLWDATAWLEDR